MDQKSIFPKIQTVLRTPDSSFINLKDFPYQPRYTEIDNLRIAHIEEGPEDGVKILLMHGEPTWSYLYRKMIPIFVASGFRVIVPDLVGCGRSDKPSDPNDYSYARHIYWMTEWMVKNNFSGLNLFCQDWGSLIGLRMVVNEPDRFDRISVGNGGLPTGDENFPFAFEIWKAFSRFSPWFPVDLIVQAGCTTTLSLDELYAYRTPFPDETFQTAVRVFPSFVPNQPNNPESNNNREAWKFFEKWEKPFLTLFSDKDPITAGGSVFFKRKVPGAKNQPHEIIHNAGHFLQEDKGVELAEILVSFFNSTNK